MPNPKEQASKPDEKVVLDEDEDPEDDEEVEYEEIEVEEEVEVEEEEEEEVEEEEEEEEEEEDDDEDANNGIPDNDERKKHAELLALPPHGSEVYIGGIPHDATEDELRHFCRSIGQVVEVRIMKGKDAKENKGFAFVTFRNVEMASKAIRQLNSSEFKGKKVKCSTSQAKHRLFLGNVPRTWEEEDLRKAVSEIGPGVTGIELVKDVKVAGNNRGFAFIDYYNHACAEYSRQKMMNPKFKLGDSAPTVSWADPKNAESSATSQIKAVYVKNLPKTVTQEQLKKLFEHHGKITRVVVPPAKSGHEKKRIGFVHFAERTSAMKALKNTEKYELEGQSLECSLAKPQSEQKSGAASGLLPAYPPRVGFGMMGTGPYAAPPFVTPGFAQPMIYGRGPAMMPMLLPDGRIGYVLQQAGMHSPPPQPQPQPPPHHRNNAPKTKGRHHHHHHHSNNNTDRRFRPY